MPTSLDVSVIISTCNRCESLRRTLHSLLAQDAERCHYEIIVVDNNSSDRTTEMILSFAKQDARVCYLFERRPGVSHGRNAAIRIAGAPILAFTDDDVEVAPDWVANIRRAFAETAGVDYVTGRILPIFEHEPASWLTTRNAGPCVLRDRGDRRLYSTAGHFFPGWATANIAFRRDVFDRIGLFSSDFPRGQDLELIIRLWRAQGRGMYDPDVLVRHHIAADRLTKSYHRMWHAREGDIRARVRFAEVITADGTVLREPPRATTLFGVPAFLYRELMAEVARWLWAAASRREERTFFHECKLRRATSYVRARFRQYAAARTHAPLAELVATWRRVQRATRATRFLRRLPR